MSYLWFWRHVTNLLGIYALCILIASGITYSATTLIDCRLICFAGATLFITPFISDIILKWRSRERISPNGKAVFITGCDTGMGHMSAQRMDDLGFQVFAGCLFPNGEGAQKLRSSGSSRMHVVGLDVTSDSSVREAAAYVDHNLKDNELWAVVNNAGIFDYAYLHWADIPTAQKLIEVNAIGLIRVTQAFLSKLILSKGRVVTVASLIGRCALSGHIPYSMSKYAAVGFSEGLRLEMLKYGVQVISIEPWIHRTPMLTDDVVCKILSRNWDKAPKDVKAMYSLNYIQKLADKFIFIIKFWGCDSGSSVVDIAEEGIISAHPRPVYISGNMFQKFIMWLCMHVPRPITEVVLLYVLP